MRAFQPKQSSSLSVRAGGPTPFLGASRGTKMALSARKGLGGCSDKGHITPTDLSLGRKDGKAAQLHFQFSLPGQGPLLGAAGKPPRQCCSKGRAAVKRFPAKQTGHTSGEDGFFPHLWVFSFLRRHIHSGHITSFWVSSRPMFLPDNEVWSLELSTHRGIPSLFHHSCHMQPVPPASDVSP